MSVHTPAVHPQRLPTFPNLAPFAMAVTLIVVFAAALLLIRPFAVSQTATTGEWMTQHRQSEIQEGLSGAPAADVLIQRAGEIGAGQTNPLIKAVGMPAFPSGFTANYNAASPVDRPLAHTVGLPAFPTGFTSSYSPLQ
jgi:hypothetical protein